MTESGGQIHIKSIIEAADATPVVSEIDRITRAALASEEQVERLIEAMEGLPQAMQEAVKAGRIDRGAGAGDITAEPAGRGGGGGWFGSPLAQQLWGYATAGLGIMSGGAVLSAEQRGMADYREHLMMLDAMGRRLRDLGTDYGQFRREVIETAEQLGMMNSEMISALDNYSRMVGTALRGGDWRTLRTDVAALAPFSWAYGLPTEQMVGGYGQAVRMGVESMSPQQFAATIAEAIQSGRMAGREGEVVDSLMALTATLSRYTVSVEQGQFNYLASLQATLNQSGIAGLTGMSGTQLLTNLNQAIMRPGMGEAGEIFMYRALTGGAWMPYPEYQYLREEGLAGVGPTGRPNIQAMFEYAQQTFGPGRLGQYMMSQWTGMTMHQIDALQRALFTEGGQFRTAQFGELQRMVGDTRLETISPTVFPLLARLAGGEDVTGIAKEFTALGGRLPAGELTRESLAQALVEYGQGAMEGTLRPLMTEGENLRATLADISREFENLGASMHEAVLGVDRFKLDLLKWYNDVTEGMPAPVRALIPPAAIGAGTMLLGQGVRALFRGGGRAATSAAAAPAAAGAIPGVAAGPPMGAGATMVYLASLIAGGIVGKEAVAPWVAEKLEDLGFLPEGYAEQVAAQSWEDIGMTAARIRAMSPYRDEPWMKGPEEFGERLGFKTRASMRGVGAGAARAAIGGAATIPGMEPLAELPTWAGGVGRRVGEELAAGMEEAKETVGKAAEDLAEVVADHFPRSPAKRGPLRDARRFLPDLVREIALGATEGQMGMEGVGLSILSSLFGVKGGLGLSFGFGTAAGMFTAAAMGLGYGGTVGGGAGLGQLPGGRAGYGGGAGYGGAATVYNAPLTPSAIPAWEPSGDPELDALGTFLNKELEGTGLAGYGPLIAKLSKQYGVPWQLAMAQFKKEGSYASAGVAAHSFNPGNLRDLPGRWGELDPNDPIYRSSVSGEFARYKDMPTGIEAYFKLIANVYSGYVEAGDWTGLVYKYAPPSENASAVYVQQMTGFMAELDAQAQAFMRERNVQEATEREAARARRAESVGAGAMIAREQSRAAGAAATDTLSVKFLPLRVQVDAGGKRMEEDAHPMYDGVVSWRRRGGSRR